MFNKVALVTLLLPGSVYTANWWSSGSIVVHQDPSNPNLQTGKTNEICPHEGQSVIAEDGGEEFIHIVSPQIAQKELDRKTALELAEQQAKLEREAEVRRIQKEKENEETGEMSGVFFAEYGAPSCVDRKDAAATVAVLHKGVERFGKQLQTEIGQIGVWIKDLLSED